MNKALLVITAVLSATPKHLASYGGSCHLVTMKKRSNSEKEKGGKIWEEGVDYASVNLAKGLGTVQYTVGW